ncbi:MAG: hypothetical protein ABSD50_16385 [Smithella sp.]
MKSRCCLALFILASLLIMVGTANAWLPKSDVKIKKIEKLTEGAVTRLAERDHYFDSSFINSYVKRLMNSIDQNNGQGAIIANDAQRWSRFTFTLDSDENIKGIEIKKYQYDFGEIFRKYNIAPGKWPDLIRQFNTTGYAITTTTSGRIKFYRNFEEDGFSVYVIP